MKPLKFVSTSYEQTLAFSARLALALRRADVVCLYGELGAGKTAFVKGLVKGLKMDPLKVHSPTFTLMNIYKGKIPLYHFDLYRIKADDLFGLGYEEYFYGSGITAIEWSERLEHLLPKVFWKVELRHAGDDERHIFVSVEGETLKERFNAFLQDNK
jgi:tRNA threonylcarbamoyladenosine biosynthesis protein TsaE